MIYGATIFIFPDENLCPVYATLLHEFGHVVGFGGHTSDGCVMDPINLGNTHLSESVHAMVHRLYQLPIGSYLP
jgi:predicted Zn-dependent protease